MFHYERENKNERTWRPDLVARIMKWINDLPQESLPYLRSLAVTAYGGFAANFTVPGNRRRPPRDVSFGFDCSADWWIETDDTVCFLEGETTFTHHLLLSMAEAATQTQRDP